MIRAAVLEELRKLGGKYPDTSLLALIATAFANQSPIPYEPESVAICDDEVLLTALRELRASTPDPDPELALDEVYLHGCWSPVAFGHYLYSRTGIVVHGTLYDSMTARFGGALDGGLCGERRLGIFDGGNGKLRWPGNADYQPHNRGRVVRSQGWCALAFWDRTADTRYGSNTVIIAKGTHGFDALCRIAARYFPQQWARITAAGPMVEATSL